MKPDQTEESKAPKKGKVSFCCDEVEDGLQPMIVFELTGQREIIFRSNVVCESQATAKEFCMSIFRILSNQNKENLVFNTVPEEMT